LVPATKGGVPVPAGKIRTEGKTYQMQEGDVVEFKFNV
jgi:ribosome-binding ATPase YchF (GTP1/OBG family)